MEEEKEVSPVCEAVLERGITRDVCLDFREIRRFVICKAWKIMEKEKVPFRDAIKRSWAGAKEECRKLHVFSSQSQ